MTLKTKPMRNLKLIAASMNGEPFALQEEKLLAIQNVVAQAINGEDFVLDEELKSQAPARQTFGSTVVIPMRGTLFKRLSGMQAFSGGVSMEGTRNKIQEALDNPKVNSIVLSIDSPGGTVAGTMELSDFITQAKAVKPIIAYADGLMASAGYWIGASCSKIVAYSTANIGSIGVVTSHADFSKYDEENGVKITHIYAGKYKAAGNPNEPLSDESKDYIQSRIDGIYTLFVDSVAYNRNIEKQKVIDTQAKVFLAGEALEAGLIDHIGSLEYAVTLAQNLAKEKEGETMNLKETIKEHGLVEITQALIEAHGESMSDEVKNTLSGIATPTMKLDPAVQAQLDGIQARLDEERKLRIEAEDTIKANQEKEVLKELKASIQESLKVEATDELVEALASLNEESRTSVLATINSLQGQVTSIPEGLTKPVGSIQDVPEEKKNIKTFDDAVTMIENRDNCDVEEAIVLAGKEFPHLEYRKTAKDAD